MNSRDDGQTGVQVDLLEYQQLKAEQLDRISRRDNLLYATLAAYGAAGWAALTGHVVAWLAAPVAAVVLGWTYLANDVMVTAIGRYVRTGLGPRLAEFASQEVFGWEHEHPADRRRRSRKTLQLAVDLLAYVATPLGALVAYWSTGPRFVPLAAVSVLEAAAVVVLAAQISTYAARGPLGDR